MATAETATTGGALDSPEPRERPVLGSGCLVLVGGNSLAARKAGAGEGPALSLDIKAQRKGR